MIGNLWPSKLLIDRKLLSSSTSAPVLQTHCKYCAQRLLTQAVHDLGLRNNLVQFIGYFSLDFLTGTACIRLVCRKGKPTGACQTQHFSNLRQPLST